MGFTDLPANRIALAKTIDLLVDPTAEVTITSPIVSAVKSQYQQSATTILEMGFTENQASKALSRSNGDLEQALVLLMDGAIPNDEAATTYQQPTQRSASNLNANTRSQEFLFNQGQTFQQPQTYPAPVTSFNPFSRNQYTTQMDAPTIPPHQPSNDRYSAFSNMDAQPSIFDAKPPQQKAAKASDPFEEDASIIAEFDPFSDVNRL
jgi:UBA/TS-N domain